MISYSMVFSFETSWEAALNFLEIYEVKIIFIIGKLFCSLLFFHQYIVEFSGGLWYMDITINWMQKEMWNSTCLSLSWILKRLKKYRPGLVGQLVEASSHTPKRLQVWFLVRQGTYLNGRFNPSLECVWKATSVSLTSVFLFPYLAL